MKRRERGGARRCDGHFQTKRLGPRCSALPGSLDLYVANNGRKNGATSARANCHSNNKRGGGASFARRCKLNISLEFSWRPRDVVITPPPSPPHKATHQHFFCAARPTLAAPAAVENKCISYSERRWGMAGYSSKGEPGGR